jgi:putative heme degradation protein
MYFFAGITSVVKMKKCFRNQKMVHEKVGEGRFMKDFF